MGILLLEMSRWESEQETKGAPLPHGWRNEPLFEGAPSGAPSKRGSHSVKIGGAGVLRGGDIFLGTLRGVKPQKSAT
jgi:hypothetical protein